MFDAIRCRFAGNDASLHFIDKDFGLSNVSLDPKFEELRETITDVAKQQTYWGELKPAKWIPLEKMLEELRKHGVEVYINLFLCCFILYLFRFLLLETINNSNVINTYTRDVRNELFIVL